MAFNSFANIVTEFTWKIANWQIKWNPFEHVILRMFAIERLQNVQEFPLNQIENAWNRHNESERARQKEREREESSVCCSYIK